MRKAPRAAWLVGPFLLQERGQTAFGRGWWVAACPSRGGSMEDYFVVIATRTCSVERGPCAISLLGSLGAG
jgi:hypothetical protein